eukprot:jgi/Mesvir1/29065/Mv18373-RA.1
MRCEVTTPPSLMMSSLGGVGNNNNNVEPIRTLTFEVRGSLRVDFPDIQRRVLAHEEESNAQPTSDYNWYRLDPSWEATEEMAMRTGITRHLISPAWRVLLLSDGSTTRHLQLLTDIEVKVDLVQMAEIGYSTETLPGFAKVVKGPRLQRQVFLRSAGDGEALLYATSWWAIDNARGYLKDVNKPIWASLEMLRTDIYRSIGRLYYGDNDELSKAFGYPGPFWARHYVFWHDGAPITVIYEVFSNKLEKYLGPAQPQP